MSFSYDPTAAASSGLSYVRLRLFDTSSAAPHFQDEEVEAFLAVTGGDRNLAAAMGAETLGARFAARATSKSVGRTALSWSKNSGQYFQLARRLRAEAGVAAARPYAGGISRARREAVDADSDRVPPSFTMGQFDDGA